MAKANNKFFVSIVSLGLICANTAFAQSSANQIVGSPSASQSEQKPKTEAPPNTTPAQPEAVILPANAVVPPAPFVIKKSANSVVIPTAQASAGSSTKLENSFDIEEAKPNETAKVTIPTDLNKPAAAVESKYQERPVVSSSVKIGSTFGYRIDPFTGGARFHAGVDIKAAWGDPVGASQPGIIKFAGWHSGYGNLMIVDHGGGVTTHYAHLSSFVLPVGTRVSRGTIIGRAGSTGRSTSPHLHYEVRISDSPVNPLHPLALDETSEYFKFNPAAAQTLAQPKVLSTTDTAGPSTKLQQHNN
jgi:murein DD-endopeptidase MepM/ murein hydrolase activator NlpD